MLPEAFLIHSGIDANIWRKRKFLRLIGNWHALFFFPSIRQQLEDVRLIRFQSAPTKSSLPSLRGSNSFDPLGPRAHLSLSRIATRWEIKAQDSLHLLCNRIWRLSVNSTTLKHLRQDLFWFLRFTLRRRTQSSTWGESTSTKDFARHFFNANSRTPILRHRHPLSHRSPHHPPKKKGKGRTSAGFSTSHPSHPTRNTKDFKISREVDPSLSFGV